MPRVIRNNIPIRLGRNGTDPWKGPRQKDDKEFEQMPRVTRNNIPIRHDDSRWLISGAVCVRPRQQSNAVQVQVSTIITRKERLGGLVQLWHNYTATGDKLHTPLGAWITPTHRRWIWYYKSSTDDLYRIKKGKVYHYLHSANDRRTRSSTSYKLVWEEDLLPTFKRGAPTSILTFTNTKVTKLNECAPLATGPLLPTNFWDFFDTWGGTWMWEGIDDSQQSKHPPSNQLPSGVEVCWRQIPSFGDLRYLLLRSGLWVSCRYKEILECSVLPADSTLTLSFVIFNF